MDPEKIISGISQVEHSLEDKELKQDADENAALEHSLGPLDAAKAYPMALFWCVVVSMCVVMEGYDQILVQNFYAYPTFQKKYGVFVGVTPTTKSGYQLTAAWQAGLSNAAGVGSFFGVFANGYLVTKYGHRIVLIASLWALTAFIFLTFFAPNIETLLVGEILCGIPWGVFATVAPAYASECLPMSLRVYLTSWTNMCFIIGQLISAGVLRGLQSRTDEWGYRIPFALQWMWPVFLIPLIHFAPSSPWHEVRQGRLEEAERSLKRLQKQTGNADPKKALAAIIYTNKLEEELSVGTSYWDCFKGFELRRTEIACMCFVGQVLSGINFAYNSSYFFEQLGLSTETTYSLNLGGTGLAFLGTILNWFCVMPYFGRRTIYVSGMLAMTLTLLVIGILNPWTSKQGVGYTQAVLCLVWTLLFQLSVGQLGWALPAEIGSTRLRQKTICLARNAYYIANIIAGVLEPYFINPTAWNLRGFTAFFWGGTAFLLLIWAYFRLPETKGRTYEELDVLFAKGVNARHFKRTDVSGVDVAQLHASA